MLKWISSVIDRLLTLVGALVFSQVPMFIQQYTLRLSGHVSELQLQIGKMQHSGKGLNEVVQKFLAAGDPDFVRHGEVVAGMIQRQYDLSQGLLALNNASVFTRPFVFLSHLDLGVAAATWHSFTMGIAMTVETLVYAVMGMGIGYIIYAACSKVCSWVTHRLSLSVKK